MYNFANKFLYLELRLFIAVIVSIIIIISDNKFNMLIPFKNYIEDSICLFYRICYQPIYIFEYVSKILSGYTALMIENNTLHQELYLKKSELLLMDHYREENRMLHRLLESPICVTHPNLIAQIFFINKNMNTFSEQAIINRGISDGIYVGQPVISNLGVVGQIISVNRISSRILLISDYDHALSVKLKHNNTRMILVGRGNNIDLKAEYFGEIKVNPNDILVTSGLDGKFPEGYPVAIVSNIKMNLEKDITIIEAKPIAQLQCLRYVVLIWNKYH